MELWNLAISVVALLVSVVALGLSVYFWRRQFRPIVTAAVKTRSSDSAAIAYDLVLRNSGTIPAKNVKLKEDGKSLAEALGRDATAENRDRWLRCFHMSPAVAMLQNDDHASCAFVTTKAKDNGFWRYGAEFHIAISYDGWFGKHYEDAQILKIVDSNSFTGYHWG